MTHYVVVQLAPTNEETLKRYYAVGGAAVKKHGGQAIAGGLEVKVLEENGGAGAPVKVLLGFPSAEAAQSWIDDPELAEVHALRRSGAETKITLLPPM